MRLTQEVKASIDRMDYTSMLREWRFAPIGDTMFQGESGDYFSKVMAKKREEVGSEKHTEASKSIGW